MSNTTALSPAALYAEMKVLRDTLRQNRDELHKQLVAIEAELERLDRNQGKLLVAITGDPQFDNKGLILRMKEIELAVEEMTGLKLNDMRKFLDNYKSFQKSLLWLAAAAVPVGSALVWAMLNMDRIIQLFGS